MTTTAIRARELLKNYERIMLNSAEYATQVYQNTKLSDLFPTISAQLDYGIYNVLDALYQVRDVLQTIRTESLQDFSTLLNTNLECLTSYLELHDIILELSTDLAMKLPTNVMSGTVIPLDSIQTNFRNIITSAKNAEKEFHDLFIYRPFYKTATTLPTDTFSYSPKFKAYHSMHSLISDAQENPKTLLLGIVVNDARNHGDMIFAYEEDGQLTLASPSELSLGALIREPLDYSFFRDEKFPRNPFHHNSYPPLINLIGAEAEREFYEEDSFHVTDSNYEPVCYDGETVSEFDKCYLSERVFTYVLMEKLFNYITKY